MPAIFPVKTGSAFDPNGADYSGKFIPAVWSAKLNAKFYAASVFGEIANTDWQGEVANMGDKVIIINPPSITVSKYEVGQTLTYEVPEASTTELIVDQGRKFSFQISDVLEYQAKPNLLDMFSTDAAERMRTSIDSTVLYNSFNKSDPANKGSAAGKRSASYDLGTDAAPVVLTGANVLQKILELASVLDEQDIPDTDRWLLIDPYTRTLLMQSNLAQAQFTGDAASPVRNGKIGAIDRFSLYLTNQLPRSNAGANSPWLSGDNTENTITSTSALKRRTLVAGHKSAITFASQLTKMETIRNPFDFGDFVRSLNVFGHKVVKPDAMATLITA